MTRLYFIFILTVTFSISLIAQDILILQNGDEIKAIVREVGTSEIKYVKFDNQNGPLYSELKSGVFMIKYENGTKDVFQDSNSRIEKKDEKKSEEKDLSSQLLEVRQSFFNKKYHLGGSRINKHQFVNELRKDPEAYAHYSGYPTNRIVVKFLSAIGWVGIIIAISFTINNQNQAALGAAIVGVGLSFIRRVYSKKAETNLELAVLTYNKNLEE